MRDVQVIRLLDLLDVNKIEEAVGVSPRSIIVRGTDFDSVEQVHINGMLAPEFVVMDTRSLVAEVPLPLRNTVLTTASVLSKTLTLTDRSLVEFTVGHPSAIEGPAQMMQNFLRILLRTPGSNVFHPNSGGGMLKRIGPTVDKSAAADIALSIARTKTYIISVQSPRRNIPAEERLLNAEIANLSIDAATSNIDVTIVLTSHTGLRTGSTLTL